MADAILKTFGEILEEDVPLLTRWLFENRMSVRHKIPVILKYGKEHGDSSLYKYMLSKSTPADIRDYIRENSKSVLVVDEKTGQSKKILKYHFSAAQKKLINEALYQIDPDKLQFWYSKYGPPTFKEIFQATHPSPDRWTIPWFQKAIYGEKAPEDSTIGKVRKARKSYTGAKEGLKELLDGGTPWHSVAQKWSVGTFLKDYLTHERVPLKFVIERLDLYKDKPEMIDLALARFKAQNRAPRIPISVVLDEVEKHLTPKKYGGDLSQKQSELRLAMLDVAQRVLMNTIVDEKFIGKTAILIDKSGSMNVSIKLGITLGGLIAARLPSEQVKLVFFDSVGFSSDGANFTVPESVFDMLFLRDKIEGNGNTHILSGLAEMRKIMPEGGYDTIFIISDGKIHDGQTYTFNRLQGTTINTIADALNYMKPKRVIYLKVQSSENNIPQLDVALDRYRDDYGGSVIKIEPESGKDTEAVLAIATYYRNMELLKELQTIKGDIINWAEANWEDRKIIEYMVAKKCGNCGAPVPKIMDYCLHCGCSEVE